MVGRTVSDVVKDQDPLTLPGSALLREAVRGMAERRVGAVLIVEDGTLAGIFTGTDLVRAVAGGLDPDATPIAAVMTHDPQTVRPGAVAIEALHRMHDGRFRHLPVIDAEGRIVGILSRRDFLPEEIDELERQEKLWEEM